ncbi:hypothetical protein ACSBR2_028839 [Camellia fascicularis]
MGCSGIGTLGGARAGSCRWRCYRQTRCSRTRAKSSPDPSGRSSASTMVTEAPRQLDILCVYATIAAEDGGVVTADTLRRAFLETEQGFTAHVLRLWNARSNLASVGSCFLVGVIYQQTLFVANLGDSRVVLGKRVGNMGVIAAIQLSTEHNANIEAVRHELKELHPNDPQIVVLKYGDWRVKGIIQSILCSK